MPELLPSIPQVFHQLVNAPDESKRVPPARLAGRGHRSPAGSVLLFLSWRLEAGRT